MQTDVGVPVFRSEAPSRWRYMGDYRFALVDDVTGDEWSEMDDKVSFDRLLFQPSLLLTPVMERHEQRGTAFSIN